MPFANPDRQRELPNRHFAFNLRHNLAGRAFPRTPQVVDAPQVDLAHHRHIPVRRRPKLPIHFQVLHQVLPAVARAHKPAAHPREPAARRHRQRPLVLPRQQHIVPGEVHRPSRVPRPAAIQMRRQKRIQLQPRHQVRACLQPNPLQHHPMVGIANHLLGQAVATIGIAVHIPHPQRVGIDGLERRWHVALLFVRKRLPIGQQELHVPHLRTIDRGVIHLVQNSVRARKPDAARTRIRRHHRILHARSPARLQARRAKGFALLLKPPVHGLIAHAYLPIVVFWNSEFVVIGDGKNKKACNCRGKPHTAYSFRRILPADRC